MSKKETVQKQSNTDRKKKKPEADLDMSAGFHPSTREEDEEDLGEDSDDPISPRSQPATQPLTPHSLSDCNSRGLSNYYKGKSQSFTTLSEVKSLGDLPKKEKGIPETRKKKTCRGYGGGILDDEQSSFSVSMASCGSSIPRTSSSSFLCHQRRLPPLRVHKNL